MLGEARRLITNAPARDDTVLGPGTVLASGPRVARVRLVSGVVVDVVLALAFTYQPVPGDTLLVIGRDADHYAIGVIEGRGRADLTFGGDVRLHAEGELSLSSSKGVSLQGPRVDLVADTVSLLAKAAVQKFDTLHQRVREMLTVHARESHTTVEETALQRGKKVVIVAEETASVNGKQILLG